MMCPLCPPTRNICYVCGTDHAPVERSRALVPLTAATAANPGAVQSVAREFFTPGVRARNAANAPSAFSRTVSSRDFYTVVLPYLGPCGAGALSRTSRHFHSIIESMLRDENVLLQLLRRHFPQFTPRRDVGGAPTCSAFQSWQRLGAKGLQAACLRSLHFSGIACMQMSSDGRRVLWGDTNGSINFLNLETGDSLSLGSHHCRVTRLQMTSDGTRALSASTHEDPTLKFWNLETEGQSLLRTLTGHHGQIHCLQLAADGRRAVSGSEDRTVRVWNPETGECRTLTGHNAPVNIVRMTPDGSRVFSGSLDQTVKIWDAETGECLQTFPAPHRITTLEVTPDGSRLLAGLFDGTLRLWDLESGEALMTFGVEGAEEGVEGVQRLGILPDGRRALAASPDSHLRLWDLATGECLRTFTGHRGRIPCLQFTSDGRRAVSGGEDGTSKLWDLETGECLKTLCGNVPNDRPNDPITWLQITLDGTRVFSVNFHNQFKHWELFPLLEERISAAINVCGDGPCRKYEVLHSLPQFVTADLLAIERARRRVLAERGNGSLEQEENYLLRGCLEIYNATQIALPGIEASLRRAANESIFPGESLRRVANLSLPIRNTLYNNLYEIHRERGILPELTYGPFGEWNTYVLYGERAFFGECSIEDRVQAVIRTIRGYRGLLSGPGAVSQPPIGNLPPVTALIAVRYHGNPGDRLYIHGSGPGMEGWRRGVEMRHENGLWIYESAEPFETFEFKVMLNDQQWEAGWNHTISTGVPVVLDVVTFQASP